MTTFLVIYDDKENHKPIGICATKEDAQDLILSIVEEKEYNKVMADGFEHFNKIYKLLEGMKEKELMKKDTSG